MAADCRMAGSPVRAGRMAGRRISRLASGTGIRHRVPVFFHNQGAHFLWERGTLHAAPFMKKEQVKKPPGGRTGGKMEEIKLYLKEAEEHLYDELSLALGAGRQETEERIIRKLKQAEQSKSSEN